MLSYFRKDIKSKICIPEEIQTQYIHKSPKNKKIQCKETGKGFSIIHIKIKYTHMYIYHS